MKLLHLFSFLFRRRPTPPRYRRSILLCEELESRLVPSGLPFLLNNQTDQPVHFAMYGIDNSSGQWSYFQSDSSTGNTFSGALVPTQQLGAGNDLPTSSFVGPAATLLLPETPRGISSAAIVITVGDVAPSITVASNFTLPRPAPSNPTLVNATTNPYYDYIEFTLDGSNTLWINTTQVDQFGFPITLTASPEPAAAPVGVTPGISRDAIFQAFASFLDQESDPAAQDYLPLLQTAPEGSPYRLIAPGQYLATPGKSSDPLASYFDSAIQSFFIAPPPLTLIASGFTFGGTATTHNPVASNDLINGLTLTNPADNRDFRVIDFVAQPGSGALAGQHFYIYSPSDAPSWVQVPSAGEQVFANNGVFADNGMRFSGQQSSILGNLENQVVSALTRGIANLPTPAQYANTTAFWTDPSQAFPEGQAANLYAKFLHTGEVNGTEIFLGGRVYAFPYSDQGEQAAFFAVHAPTSVSITLGAWSGTQAVSPIITSGAPPTAASVGSAYSYQLTASGSPAPTLSATGLPAWLSFNASTGLLTGTPTSSAAGTSATITLTASNGVLPDAVMTFTVNVAPATVPTTPIGNTLYLLSSGTLSADAGSSAHGDTIASAGGSNHDDAPTNARIYEIQGLTGTYDPTRQTQFTLFLDAGTQVANGTQVRVSYDCNGDGVHDRVETFRYFAENDLAGWEAYTRAAGLRSAMGSFANLQNGSVKIEVWNAIGSAPVSLRTDASASDGLQSAIIIPFANLTQSSDTNVVPALTGLSVSSVPAGSPALAITLAGTNFNGSSTALFNGTPLATTWISATQLSTVIPAANLAAPRTASIAIYNPGPGGGSSAALMFTITAATPALLVSPSSLALGTTTAGTASSPVAFTVSGSNLLGDLVIVAPAGVQLSSDGATYSTTLNLAPDATGMVAPTTIQARIAASAGTGTIADAIAVTSSIAAGKSVAVTGTVVSETSTPIDSTLYLLSSGVLSTTAGTSAGSDTIASAAGRNYDGTPTNALVYNIRGLTGTYDPARHTQFTLLVDAGTQVANGTQLRVSYDCNGDGTYDRVETYRYFAADDRPGWEAYTQALGLLSATGSFANFQNGSVTLEVWNAIGRAPVALRTDASSSDGQQSALRIPFTNLNLT